MTAGRRSGERHGPIGILGGTFDPVHMGHIAVAAAARQALGLDVVQLVPTGTPPHRTQPPHASIYHRFAMTALAALSDEGMEVSDLDCATPGPSYTSLLLDRLHNQGYRTSQIVFIIGADAFAEIATWHRYPAVLEQCHFAVISRPGQQTDALRARLPHLAARFTAPSGPIETRPPAVFLIDAATPDVSSTDIRERRRAGVSIDGLVPGLVEQYIRRHALYADTVSTAGHLHEHTAQ